MLSFFILQIIQKVTYMPLREVYKCIVIISVSYMYFYRLALYNLVLVLTDIFIKIQAVQIMNVAW